MKKPLKSKNKKQKRPGINLISSPFVFGLLGTLPFFVVIILVVAIGYSFAVDTPQKNLVQLSFDDRSHVTETARIMLEKGDPVMAKMIYSKMIDGVNLNNGMMSTDWVDEMILDLNPKTGLSEDIRTKTMMSESIKSKELYLQLAKMFGELGFEDKSQEARSKALDIDPLD